MLGVALLLDDQQVLDEFGETYDTVLSRYAYDLLGRRDARADVAAGYPATAAWLRDAATELATATQKDRSA